ncbi:hypothetical protein AVEN_29227-1 [Araneus ventricosus]|uniref:Uncharacterized protein n=1 Tax=Araneus ventricosus TaxID=182803 RepID=A0A4Y2DY04_ARAVE|nr:hypothetical protein AVEN_29227-1 [Araneus ventricosus]
MYGSPIWESMSTVNIRRLQLFQNKRLMHVVNALWHARRKVIHKDLKTEPVSEFIKRASIKMFRKNTPDFQRTASKASLQSSYPQLEEKSESYAGYIK